MHTNRINPTQNVSATTTLKRSSFYRKSAILLFLSIRSGSHARKYLHEWVSQAKQSEFSTLAISTPPSQRFPLTVEFSTHTMNEEVDEMESFALSWREIDLESPPDAKASPKYWQMRELEHAEKLLYEWTLQHPDQVRQIYVLAGKKEIDRKSVV